MKWVVHCQRERYDVYIGRPSIWGNPFSHKSGTLARFRVATRAEAIRMFEESLADQPELVARARRELRAKVLGCWCDPQPCHGHVWAKIANEAPLVIGNTS
jgi:hypothetical protein